MPCASPYGNTNSVPVDKYVLLMDRRFLCKKTDSSKEQRERSEILPVSERTKMYLHFSFMPVPPVIRQPTANPRFFPVVDPRTGVTEASGGRITYRSMGNGGKKRALRNTRKRIPFFVLIWGILPIRLILWGFFQRWTSLPGSTVHQNFLKDK